MTGITIEQLEAWHAAREHEIICDTILALPEGERTDELVCLLARALSNLGDYKSAIGRRLSSAYKVSTELTKAKPIPFAAIRAADFGFLNGAILTSAWQFAAP